MRASKKFYTRFSHFDIKQSVAQTNKNLTFLFDVHRENETKVTGVYLQCGRNEAFYCDFFVETD